MNLQTITKQVFYIPGAVNIGVLPTRNNGAIVIDTGSGKDAARQIRKVLDAAGLTLRAIISTHHHADHIGGNAYLTKMFPEAQVYAPPIEAIVIAYPSLEPAFLNLGATPHAALRTRWLMAEPSPVHHVIGDFETMTQGGSQSLQIEDVMLEVVPLPGHTIAQIGIAIDGVCFVADGYFGTSVLEKYGVPYAHNIAAQRESLERLSQRQDAWFLPGHGPLTPHSEIQEVLHINRLAITHASETILQSLPGDSVSITARVMQHYGQQTRTDTRPAMLIAQYVIFASAVNAHLSYLEQQQRAKVVLEEHGLVWYRM